MSTPQKQPTISHSADEPASPPSPSDIGEAKVEAAWLPVGGGQMGAAVRAFDWRSTPLGPLDQWPLSLRVAAGICLNGQFPMAIWWGVDLTLIYNDAYVPLLEKRHPNALGKSGRLVWAEAWEKVGPHIEHVMRRDTPAAWDHDHFILERNGTPQDAWFTWSLSPLSDERGVVVGVFNTCQEDTALVLAQREQERLAEQRHMALIAANLGWWRVDPVTNDVIFDDRFRELFGLPPDRLRIPYQQAFQSIHPDDRDRVDAAVRAALNPHDPRPYAAEYRTVHPDGSIRWVFARGRAYFTGHGSNKHYTNFIGTLTDISERKRAEDQRREIAGRFAEQSRLFDRLLSSITDFAYTFDLEGRFTFANKPLLDLWGITLKEAIGKNFFDLHYPHDLAARLQQQIRQVIQTKQRVVGETFYTSPTGKDAFYQYIFSAVIGPDGSVESVAGSTRDITDQKRIEERERQAAVEALVAAEANAKFRTFFEQGTYFAGVMSVNGTVIEANRLSLEAGGFTREDIIGRKFWDCGWWTPLPALVEMVKAGSLQAAAGRPFRCETIYFRADGTQRFVDLSLSPVTDESGRVLFVAPTGADITDRKRAEVELERLLQSERNARAEADAANQAKDRFLAVLSHELRTPLSPVVMAIPSIENDPELPPKFREDLAMVRRNIDLEVKLIDDLLDLSRAASGKLRLHMQPVSVHEVLQHAIHNSTSDAPAKRHNIRQEFHAPNDSFRGDPARLQQVFWNLLRNALKFTPDDGDIIVRTSNSHDNAQLLIEIKDNGVGIPPDILPRIFDAFEQGDPGMSRQFGGLGLGLAIAKAVVEMHGGTISAASGGWDQGATFTVELNTTAEADTPDAPATIPQAPHSQDLTRTRVMLVEDHPDTARMLSRLLASSGYDVQTANSMAAALKLAASQTFDVVVSDIGLPDATGYQLMQQLRDTYGTKGIALSGYGMEEDMRKSRAAGFVDHVVKPVNVDQLEAVIRRVIGLPE